MAAIAAVSKRMVKEEAFGQRFIRYQQQLHTELARQRHEILDDLHATLNQGCLASYPFDGWQRVVRIKYAAHPLCVRGSLAGYGGRFNIGAIAPDLFPVFSAMYLAPDKETAFQEVLGQGADQPGAQLTALELALSKPDSIASYSVSGHLETVFDLRNAASLKEFVKLTNRFSLSSDLRRRAKHLPVAPPRVIRNVTELRETLLHREWRAVPTLGEIPSNSQVFGHLSWGAGIVAILYPSKFNSKPCLAIYPENMKGTSSWVALDHDVPFMTAPPRIDRTNWEVVERDVEELMAS